MLYVPCIHRIGMVKEVDNAVEGHKMSFANRQFGAFKQTQRMAYPLL
ncbi:MAG: hypothetical protein J6R28_07030 [Bacteroides sp.]|nr:hypothetical protein [Bacteroides sp.]